MVKASSSGFNAAGGPAECLLIALIDGVGMVATVAPPCTLTGWRPLRRTVN